ncbi:hypothetical protein GCM10007092_11070 [Thermus composti]|uniref:Uncharacterized protein n=1 Tax=Thermus composti TaxID=532059 RepID=A0ABV6Q4H8_9DEIN|nr:hypothetical protein [Thermus composti]GGM99009.1 hypothetical protein GCM10007092_11070 [Thermus composti]
MDVAGVILEALRPHLGPRAEAVLEEGLKRLGRGARELSPEDGALLLKGLVFRELQGRLRPEEARRVVQEALRRLEGQGPSLEELEKALKRFGLYVDWPEVGRLRALWNRLRQSPDPALLGEAKALLEALEERLEEALLRQAKDLAYLEESLERVRHLGGAKVRRLENLVATIRKAQEEGIWAQGEVERARGLALDLRKLLESSAVQAPTLPEMVFETQEFSPEEEVYLTVEDASELEGELVVDLGTLPEEAAQRILALEVEEERRRLEELLARYGHLLERTTVSPLLAEVQALLEAGKPAGERLKALEEAFKEAEANFRAERRARLIQLQEALRALPLPPEEKASLQETLALAEETLKEGGYPDLAPLEAELGRLEALAQAREAEEKRLLQEKEALLRELAQKGEAFQDLLKELQALGGPALREGLDRIRARYAERLKAQGEEAQYRGKLEEAQKALEALREEAKALGLEGLLEEAALLLAQGRLPDLEGLKARLQEAKEEARRRALEELSRLQALAERFRGFGGEAALKALEEEKQKPLPDPTPVARTLHALRRRLEAKREELNTRLTAFFQAQARLEGFQSETARRLKPLLATLRSARDQLPRLGPKGVLQVEKTLTQAEALLKELEKEAEAAKALLQEFRSADLEALLGALEVSEDPLAPLRLPGVEALGYLEDAPPLPPEALRPLVLALDRLDQALKDTRKATVVLLREKALVLSPHRGKNLVALLEKPSLSAFLQELSS